MRRAGITRVGPTGEPRTSHSFRHTFAKIALENQRPVTWLSRHLGHSSVQVTTGVYGHFAGGAQAAGSDDGGRGQERPARLDRLRGGRRRNHLSKVGPAPPTTSRGWVFR